MLLFREWLGCDPRFMPFAASDARPLYAAPSHFVCVISGGDTLTSLTLTKLKQQQVSETTK
jgi:hypothetical protein